MVRDLELEPLGVARALRVALAGVGIEQGEPRLEPAQGLGSQEGVERLAVGVGKSGSRLLPSVNSKLQRRAISTLLASASGMSANSSAISACVLKYC